MAERRHLAIRDGSLAVAPALEFVADPAFGGYTSFVGRIRASNHGREVLAVSYDVFAPLATARLAAIADEADAEAGGPVRLWIEHARGRLAVGEVAVVIAVGCVHRDEAFRACRVAIEAVKHTTPIWKQEHFADGDSAWSECCSLCRV